LLGSPDPLFAFENTVTDINIVPVVAMLLTKPQIIMFYLLDRSFVK
jgi:hypothetical protein